MPEKDYSYYCSCPKWTVNFPLINAPFLLPLTAVGEYDGEPFEYCPWCGKKLVEYKGPWDFCFGNQQSLPCVCGTPAFHQSTAGCLVHGTIEFGVYE